MEAQSQEPQLPITMSEEMLLGNWALSDIAESELWEAHHPWPAATADDTILGPEDKSEEIFSSTSIVDAQMSESTVSSYIHIIE